MSISAHVVLMCHCYKNNDTIIPACLFYYSYLLGVGIDDDDGISSYVDVCRSVGIAVGSGPGSIV